MKAKAFDRKFERGDNLTQHLDLAKAREAPHDHQGLDRGTPPRAGGVNARTNDHVREHPGASQVRTAGGVQLECGGFFA